MLCSPSTPGQTSIVCTVPGGQGFNQSIKVSVAGQTSNALNYTYAAPIIGSVNPTYGGTKGGEVLTISGYRFVLLCLSVSLSSLSLS